MAAQENSKELYHLLVDVAARFSKNIIFRPPEKMKITK